MLLMMLLRSPQAVRRAVGGSQLAVQHLHAAPQPPNLVFPLGHLQAQHHHAILHHFGDLRRGGVAQGGNDGADLAVESRATRHDNLREGHGNNRLNHGGRFTLGGLVELRASCVLFCTS